MNWSVTTYIRASTLAVICAPLVCDISQSLHLKLGLWEMNETGFKYELLEFRVLSKS